MPLYEYEPLDWDCLICGGRFEHLQSISEPNLEHCPTCGMPVRRLVSKAQIKVAKYLNHEHAGKKGFTVFKKVEEGKWEKVAGQGVDMIVGTDTDMQAIREEKKQKKVPKRLSLDDPS